MRAIPILLISFVTGIPVLHSQEEAGIEGRVVDAVTGRPVRGANVELHGTSYGAATDEQGHFVIRSLLRGEYSLVVTHIAYDAARIDGIRVGPERSPSVLIRLQPRILVLPAVRVEAERRYSVAAGRTVVDRKTIEAMGASNLREILEFIPSVAVNRQGNSSTVSIRGSSSNQVLVLFDGVPLNDPITGTVDVESLPSALIESVEVRKTASAAEYGAGALGGVVIVRPRRTYASLAEFGVRSGSYGTLETAPCVRLSLPWGFSIGAAGDLFRWAGDYGYSYKIGEETRHAVRRNSDLRRANALLQLQGGKDIQLRTDLLYMSSERGIPGSVYALSPYARANQHRLVASAAIAFEALDGNASVRLSLDENRSAYVNRPPSNAPVRGRSVPPYDSELRYTTLALHSGWGKWLGGGRLEASGEIRTSRLRLRDRLRGVAGIERAAARLGSAGLGWRGQRTVGRSELEFHLAARISRAALQAPEIIRRYVLIAPEASLSLGRTSQITRSATIRISRGLRLPTYGDLFYQDYRVRGNPNLRPERSWDVVGTVQFGAQLLGAHVTLRMDLYRRWIDDFITWRLGAFASFSPVNVDAEVRGHEVSASFSSSFMDGDLTFEAMRTRNLSPDATIHGKELPFRPAYRATCRLVLKWGHTRLSVMPQWVGPRWVTEANTVRLQEFATLDVTASTQVMPRGRWVVTAQFQVLNVLDRRYQVLEGAPLPGREWRLGLSLRSRGHSD